MKQSKKHFILQTAVKLFYKKGFSAATTAEIAAEAGVAEVTLFRYFKTKKDLLISAIDQFTELLGEELVINPLNEILELKSTRSAKELIKMLLKERIELLEKNYDILWIVITEIRHHPELKEKIVLDLGKQGVEILKQIAEYGVKSGEFRTISTEAAIRAFFGTVITIIVNRKIFPDLIPTNKSLDESIDEAVDILLYGICV